MRKSLRLAAISTAFALTFGLSACGDVPTGNNDNVRKTTSEVSATPSEAKSSLASSATESSSAAADSSDSTGDAVVSTSGDFSMKIPAGYLDIKNGEWSAGHPAKRVIVVVRKAGAGSGAGSVDKVKNIRNMGPLTAAGTTTVAGEKAYRYSGTMTDGTNKMNVRMYALNHNSDLYLILMAYNQGEAEKMANEAKEALSTWKWLD